MEIKLKYRNSRNAGHKAGLNTVEKIIKETIKINKISTLCFFNRKLKDLKKNDYDEFV